MKFLRLIFFLLSYYLMILLRDIESIIDIIFDERIDVSVMIVSYFSLIYVSFDWEMFLSISHILIEYNVFFMLLNHLIECLEINEVDLSLWEEGIWYIVFSSFQSFMIEYFESLLTQLIFWLVCRGYLIIHLLNY